MRPKQGKAQLLIETDNGENQFKKALDILKSLDFHPLQYHVVSRGRPSCFLVLLPPMDMRDAVLRLFEAGFTKVVAMDPMKETPSIPHR